jgi:hypothetical protein
MVALPQPSNDGAPMSVRDMLELSLQLETLGAANCRSLASIIAALINENEPLLRAEAEGASVTVREIGGTTTLKCVVTL